MEVKTLLTALSKYVCVVVWGLREYSVETQRYVHSHMHTTMKKIGFKVLWCDNKLENNKFIPNGSLVLSTNQCCDKLEYDKSNWYVLFNTLDHIENCRNYLKLRVYGCMEAEKDCVSFDETTLFHKKNRMLYQAFGTNLFPEEFQSPIFNTGNRLNWVGSVWNDANNHGNLSTIRRLEKVLQKHNIKFRSYSELSDEDNIVKIRESRLAPAIGGEFQTISMMPCRIWKNISYGHMCVTNLQKARDVFGEDVLCNRNIEELIETALSIGRKEYMERTLEQQKIVMQKHTYLNWFYNIVRALDEMGDL